MKKNLFLLVTLVSGFITAQAGPYYAGLNHLNKLIESIEEPIAAASADSTLTIPPVADNNSIDDPDKNWGHIQGVTWSEKMDLGYANEYYAIRSIDFSTLMLNGSAYSYTQKSNVDINWEQPDQAAIDQGPTNVDVNDLRCLTTLNLSGNKFRKFAIDGKGVMSLQTVNFSDNSTLEELTISGCPQLTTLSVNHSTAVVSVANCQLPFSALNGFSVASSNYTYAPQGTIAKTFPFDDVDLSSEYSFGANTTNFVWEDGVSPATSENGVFTFSNDYVGRTVTCTLTNAAFPQLSSGLVFQIKLKADASDIGEIATPNDLNRLRDNIYNQYVLTADIDLTKWLQTNAPEEGWDPIDDFTGTVDGAGHVISGLWSNRATNKVGLFGKISGDVEIKNLGVKIAGNKSLKGVNEVGGIVGCVISGTVSIHNCFVNGTIEAVKDAGGIAGVVIGANGGANLTIQNCYAGGEISVTADHAGGILGATNSNFSTVTIDRCYVTNTISCPSGGSVAGIVASRDGVKSLTISNCAAINPSITGGGGSASIARIIAYKQNEANVKDRNNVAYAGMLVNGSTVSQSDLSESEVNRYHGTDKTMDELKLQETYVEWDFTTPVWSMGNDEYPFPILAAIPDYKQLPLSDFIISATRSASEYTSDYGDIIFEAGGQLTGIGSEGLTAKGVVKYKNTFTPKEWYAVGFPFAPVSYWGAFEENLDLYIWNGTFGDFWVKDYDGEAFDYSAEIEAGQGYIVQFPEDFTDTEVVFTSETGVILKNVTENDLDATLAFSESNRYYLVANPSVVNLTLSAANKYYIYNGSDRFNLLTEGTATLKPFESFVVANGVAQSALKASLNIDNETALEQLQWNDPVVRTEYYNLQGLKIQRPAENTLYIVKKTHFSGKTDTVKIWNK
jgi:hypothetical protein